MKRAFDVVLSVLSLSIVVQTPLTIQLITFGSIINIELILSAVYLSVYLTEYRIRNHIAPPCSFNFLRQFLVEFKLMILLSDTLSKSVDIGFENTCEFLRGPRILLVLPTSKHSFDCFVVK